MEAWVIKRDDGKYFAGEYKNGKNKFSKTEPYLYKISCNAIADICIFQLTNCDIVKVKIRIEKVEEDE